MIDIFPVIITILLIINSKTVKPLDAINEEYLSIKLSRYYRGLFALVVVLHHLSQKTSSGAIFPLFLNTGALAVSFFFFLSGYGLQKSYIQKSVEYKRNYLKKRIPRVLIPYCVFVVIYWLTNSIIDNGYSISDVLNSFFNGYPIVSNSWYIIVILIFYLFYWLFMIICRNYKWIILCGCIWYILWVLFCFKMNYPVWWYRTAHLIIWGMIWATYESKLNNYIYTHYKWIAPIIWIGFTFIFFFQDIIISRLPHQFLSSSVIQFLLAFLFVCSVILISMKLIIGNCILGLLGDISLEIYLVHGLFINLIRIQNDFLWCLVIISLSLVTAFILHLFLSIILKKYRELIQ